MVLSLLREILRQRGSTNLKYSMESPFDKSGSFVEPG
jgi:hypothetical protein